MPKLGDLLGTGLRALEETAVAADDLILPVPGQFLERLVTEYDGLVLLVRIGQAHRHPRLCHGLLEQQPGGAGEIVRIGAEGPASLLGLVEGGTFASTITALHEKVLDLLLRAKHVLRRTRFATNVDPGRRFPP